MGALGGLSGLAGGAAGTGFAKPTGANILNPVSTDQTNESYTQNQAALAQQQGLVTALQGQNGIGNQSQVYNQFQNVASGAGPNPAQAMLNQATGANVANQASLMAGQRGAGSNVGLIARQAAQQGAQAQQQAAGQAATMQANQSLNALGQAGNIAGQQVGNQIGATTANTQAQQSEQQNLLNAIANQNNANVGMQSNINAGNAGLANGVMQGQQKAIGAALSSGAAGAGKPSARGGEVVAYADGGAVGPQSSFGQFLAGWGSNNGASTPIQFNPGMQQMSGDNGPDWKINRSSKTLQSSGQENSGMAGGAADSVGGPKTTPTEMVASRGGKVPALVSPGERYLPPSEVKAVAAGKKNPMEAGEKIPGKPKVGGAKNSYKNDTIPKTLEEGGIVLPRSVTQAKHPHWEAHKFVSALMAKKGLK